MDPIDRRIVLATQAGLPLVERPYHAVAEAVGIPAEEVMDRLRRMQEAGIVRRIGAVPDHYALGYAFNGMTVWDVADDDVAAAGARVAALPFVSHCYQRPRHPPDWPYSLFAMVHARDAEAAHALVAEIAAGLGGLSRGHLVLFSTRILKKTGLRLSA
jgi:DNA-binding Lrp family transcriptional regulator